MTRTGWLGRPAEILLVEDNNDDVEFTRLALAEVDLDHRLHVAQDGDEAISFLTRDDTPRPDLILLDLNMPRKDGRIVLREVKQHPEWRRIPVIILTTSRAVTDRAFTYSEHANAYLTKPLDLDTYFAQVNATVEFWLRWNVPPP